ncbi:hypothetical protein COY89_00710 [Candidatus Roizmanbacteria bacterium CG_4_10_14_0_8_um_filter_36_36]|nr:MAG: hypothetical protein COY89_00710 [Candidatus Roizmanbacteria bacterium CG_4_10_14_0_8_um_filter_36_36]
MLDEDLQPLLNKAYFYLKFRPRTAWEMRRYLYKKIEKTHWSRSDADKIINHLLGLGLLDDKKFIEIFIEERKNLKPKGKFVLKQELIKHGIDKQLIDDYFERTPFNEEDLAEKALYHHWSRLKDLPVEKRLQKASQFLFRRGFPFALAKKTLEKLNNKFFSQ